MLNPYGREDVENLLVQLKQYKRIIQSYQKNDISHDYFRLKSEFRELKSRFLETKQLLLQLEEKHKDCLFDKHKLLKEKDELQQEITKLKAEIKRKEVIETMESQKGKKETQPESLLSLMRNKSMNNMQFNQEFIKGAEPGTEIQNNLHQAISQSKSEQVRKLTFRDLQSATSVTQIIGSGAKEKKNLDKSNHPGQKKNESKSVYIRYKDKKEDRVTKTSNIKKTFNEEVVIPNIEMDSLQNEKVIEAIKEENVMLNSDSQLGKQDGKVQPGEKPLITESIEKKSKLKLFWEKLTNL